MNELLFKILELILKLFDWSKTKLVNVVKNYNHWLAFYLIYTIFVVRVVQFSDLIELVTKHVSILDVIEIYEKVNLKDSALNQISRSLDRKSSLAYTMVPIKNEKTKLIIFYCFHKFIELLLSPHHRRILHFFIVLSELRSRVIYNLSSESNILL